MIQSNDIWTGSVQWKYLSSVGKILVAVYETMNAFLVYYGMTIKYHSGGENHKYTQAGFWSKFSSELGVSASNVYKCHHHHYLGYYYNQAVFWSIFSAELGVSTSTGYNWQSVSASAQAEETTTTIGMTVITIMMRMRIMSMMMMMLVSASVQAEETATTIGMMVILV